MKEQEHETTENLTFTLLKAIEEEDFIPMNEPEHYYAALEKMNQHVWTKIYPTLPNADPMAFVKKSRNDDGVYEIYTNPNIPDDVQKYFLLHEFGHVIYTHLEIPFLQQQFIINKIIKFWPQLRGFFDDKQKYTQYAVIQIAHSLLNIAQDLEINGKLFSKTEWRDFQYNAQLSYVLAKANAPKTTLQEKASLYKWLKTEKSLRKNIYKGWHPDDFSFPCGLDYSQYVELMLKNQKLFFNQLMVEVNDACESIIELQQNQVQHQKLTTKQIEKLKQQYNDANPNETQKAVDSAREVDQKDAFLGDDGYSPVGSVKIKKSGGKKNGKGAGFDLSDTRKLEEFILKNCFNKKIMNTHNNTMYYYNRRKYNSDIMLSKQTSEDLYRPGNLYLLIDCSGSINEKSIKIMVNVVRHIANSLGKNSRIIWWSTVLNGDFLMREAKDPNGSGGTDIALGIAYVREKYLKSNNDKLIIISDYYDSLSHWNTELQKIKHNDCMGICWKYGNSNVQSVEEHIFASSYNSDDLAIKNQFMRKLPTVLVNI